MKRAWDVQWCFHRWPFQLGFHFDHTGPYLALHLPCAFVIFGRVPQPGFRK